jgi:hypothetical protein
VINGVLAMTALVGVSSFVAAGDSGSTTCGTSVPGTTLSYPAVSPFVTAVGGTRLTLGPGNTRTTEVVWNDSVFGVNGAGGGGVTRLQPRPAYQDGANAQNHCAVPDVSAGRYRARLARRDQLHPADRRRQQRLEPVICRGHRAGGRLRAQRRSSTGRLANGWFYKAAAQPSAFFDVTKGSNDLANVGCCQATVGYDTASGLGVPNWATQPATLPKPS